MTDANVTDPTETDPNITTETDAAPGEPTIEQLTAQLAEARAAEADRIASEQAAALERERAYRRKWLEGYDPAGLLQKVAETRTALHNAGDVSTALNALVDHQVARQREHRSAQIAYQHRAWLANDARETPPHDERGYDEIGPVYPTELADLINSLVGRAVAEWRQAEDQQFTDEVYGTGLTQEELLQAEQEAERRRREELARPAVSVSVDVSGWTDEQRKAAGLEPARSRPPSKRLGS